MLKRELFETKFRQTENTWLHSQKYCPRSTRLRRTVKSNLPRILCHQNQNDVSLLILKVFTKYSNVCKNVAVNLKHPKLCAHLDVCTAYAHQAALGLGYEFSFYAPRTSPSVEPNRRGKRQMVWIQQKWIHCLELEWANRIFSLN